ncbi:MAG: methylated-DNA--[protein]-cysteine S-methyltransferase [Microthrixaceae bacterium]
MPAPHAPSRTRSAGPAAPVLVAEAAALLDGDDPPTTLADLGRRLDRSPWHVQRTFRTATGLTPRQYLDARRLGTARGRLLAGETVLDAAFAAGFGSARAFYEKAPALALPPADLRRGAEGHLLRSTAFVTPVGRALLVVSSRGVVALRLGDDDRALAAEVAADLPGAVVEPDPDALAELAEAVLAWFDGADAVQDVPLDVRATAFQLRVLEELRRIPRGETRTYTEVAVAIGAPRSVRAVARACATNSVGLAVPCHRVVRADGGLAGYRWGIDRKAALLDLEAGFPDPGAGTGGDRTIGAGAGTDANP